MSAQWVRKPPICSMSISRSEALAVSAAYFDGKTARSHPVTLTLSGEELVVQGDTISRREPISVLRVSEPMGAAPRLIAFPDGAHCEVHDHSGFTDMLRATGHTDSWIVRMQHYWSAALAAIAISGAALTAAYVWGLPAAAEWLAFQLPEKALRELGGSTLQFLDKSLLQPSALTAERQQSLRAAFGRLAVPGSSKTAYRIEFRTGGPIRANALALPDGTIVVTDELVKLAGDDEEILAVLAHELGHLDRRHSMRMLIQGSIVAFVVAWYLGDVSGIAAGLPALVLQARYSREHEREADRFAVAMLKANAIAPRRLASMLARMEAARDDAAKKQGKASASKSAAGLDYLSSHPATAERIRELEGN